MLLYKKQTGINSGLLRNELRIYLENIENSYNAHTVNFYERTNKTPNRQVETTMRKVTA